MDVLLYSMGRIGYHISRAEYRRKLLKQKFDSCRHRMGWVIIGTTVGRTERDVSTGY